MAASGDPRRRLIEGSRKVQLPLVAKNDALSKQLASVRVSDALLCFATGYVTADKPLCAGIFRCRRLSQRSLPKGLRSRLAATTCSVGALEYDELGDNCKARSRPLSVGHGSMSSIIKSQPSISIWHLRPTTFALRGHKLRGNDVFALRIV